jgi:hypothetical protein
MKTKYIIFATCMLLFGACKRDVLDITPTDRISSTSVWSDPALAQLFVNAQYNYLQDGLRDGQFPTVQYFDGNCFISSDLGNYQTNIGKAALTADNVTSLSTNFYYWNTGYTAINNFNTFFANIDNLPASAAVKAQLTAEVRFLRAFVYAKLIWNYGGVPIIPKAFTLDETLTGVKRNTYDECVTYILADLDYAIANLPAQQAGANLGHASGDAAMALKARVLLYYASPLNNPTNDKTRWQAASDAALAVINSGRYALATDYHSMFIGGANNEIIFAKYFSTADNLHVDYYCGPPGSGGINHLAPTQTLVDAYEMTNGVIPVINGVINPDPNNHYDPNNPYANRDPRFYMSILYNGADFNGRTYQPYKGGADYEGNAATGYGMLKLIDPSLPVASTVNDNFPWIFFRLGEMYLDYAEAQYNLGNEDNARTYVDKIRARANMPLITETGTALGDRINHERYIELAFEGQWYYDVRRLKIAPQTESQPIQGLVITPGSGSGFTYTRVSLLNRVWDDKLYYLPIATQEIRSSGGSLAQNPGY